MLNAKNIEELSNKLSSLLPPGFSELKNDFEKNARAAIQTAFERMNLVSREEFDIQAALLSRTREKLEALELQLKELERQMGIK